MCGCVSLSEAGHHSLGGHDKRGRNGCSQGRALQRGSTTNNSASNGTHLKRKSTWDTTLVTVSQHNFNNIPMMTNPTKKIAYYPNANNTHTSMKKSTLPDSFSCKPHQESFPLTHDPSLPIAGKVPEGFSIKEEPNNDPNGIEEDSRTIVTTSFILGQPGINKEEERGGGDSGDIISGITCSCKESLVRKISQQNNNSPASAPDSIKLIVQDG